MKIFNLHITMLLIYCVCLFPFHAGAEEIRWKLYYSTPDGTEHYYDSKSINRTSRITVKTPKGRRKTRQSTVKIWTVKVREKMVFKNTAHELKESKILREFDCSRKMFRTLTISTLYKNGFKKIEGKAYPWESIASQSSHESLYEIVCKF